MSKIYFYLIILCCISRESYSQTKMNIDSSFGINGVLKIENLFPLNYSKLYQLQGDKTILGLADINKNIQSISRFNSNGTIDSSFGINGIYSIHDTNSLAIQMLMVAKDSSIYFSTSSNYNFSIFHLSKDGKLDSNFNTLNSSLNFDTNFRYQLNDFIEYKNKIVIYGEKINKKTTINILILPFITVLDEYGRHSDTLISKFEKLFAEYKFWNSLEMIKVLNDKLLVFGKVDVNHKRTPDYTACIQLDSNFDIDYSMGDRDGVSSFSNSNTLMYSTGFGYNRDFFHIPNTDNIYFMSYFHILDTGVYRYRFRLNLDKYDIKLKPKLFGATSHSYAIFDTIINYTYYDIEPSFHDHTSFSISNKNEIFLLHYQHDVSNNIESKNNYITVIDTNGQLVKSFCDNGYFYLPNFVSSKYTNVSYSNLRFQYHDKLLLHREYKDSVSNSNFIILSRFKLEIDSSKVKIPPNPPTPPEPLFTLYPNPTSDSFRFSKPIVEHLIIMNTLNQKIKELTKSNFYNISDLPSAIYFVWAFDKDWNYIQKFKLQKE